MSEPGKNTTGKEEVKLDRPLTLLGGIAIVIGAVVGMGIYALIGPMSAEAGPSVWLAFTIALAISLVGVIPLIQVASALPRAGGGYLFTSRLLSPFWGTLASYWGIFGGAFSTSYVSLGMSGYIIQYLPFDLPLRLVAVLLPVLFYILYLFGLRLAASLQILLVAQLFVALAAYAVAGSLQVGFNFSLEMPQGFGGFAMAIILGYTACIGFQVIGEMGEEMKNAPRNIPLSLIIGGLIVLLLYIVISVTFISVMPYDYDALMAMGAPLTETGEMLLPTFLVIFLSVGALSAGLTSFNAAATAIPREFFAQARDGMVSQVLGKIDRRTRSPLNAVTAYFILVVVIILLGGSVDFYGYLTAVGILLFTVLICISSLRLSKKYPERYRTAFLRIPRWGLMIMTVIAVISSLGFVFIVFTEMILAAFIYLAITAAVILYYFWRLSFLKRSGFPWEETISSLSGFDEEEREILE